MVKPFLRALNCVLNFVGLSPCNSALIPKGIKRFPVFVYRTPKHLFLFLPVANFIRSFCVYFSVANRHIFPIQLKKGFLSCGFFISSISKNVCTIYFIRAELDHCVQCRQNVADLFYKPDSWVFCNC